MSAWLQKKHLLIVSSVLQKFKVVQQTPFLAKFRCPYCGDSKRNTSKVRGYIYEDKDRIFFKCHNCGKTEPFSKFLSFVSPAQYDEYRFESIKGNEGEIINYVTEEQRVSYKDFLPLKNLKKISQLSPAHPAVTYVNKRKIPHSSHYRIYYCPKFYKWANTIIPNKFDASMLAKDEPRLIFPFIDKEGNVFGAQGRAFHNNGVRYITLMFDKSKPKIYGIETVDLSKKVYVTEGPIDSLFLPNCVAMAGSDLDLAKVFADISNLTLIYDNEPRNKEIVSKISKAIDNNYNVCIWGNRFKEKDINDAILAGYSSSTVKDIIDKNTFSGLEARIKFNEWSRINGKEQNSSY